MEFSTTESQSMIAQSVRDLCERELRPHVMEWDEAQHMPVDLFKKHFGPAGMLGVLVPEEYGGAGLGYYEYISTIVETARICGSVGLSVAAHNSLCTGHILYFANAEQKQRWLPKLATGEWLGAWALTEPNTGSDAMRMKCTARKEGNEWVLNGTKCWITHGISSDVLVAIVRTGELLDSKGMTAFVIERGTPGLKAGKKENKLGMRSSETAEVIFDDCRIPEENVLGNVGEGFQQAMKVLDGGRISIAALSLGIARGAFDASVKYAKERQQFGKPLFAFPRVSGKLAWMAVEIMIARQLTLFAAREKDADRRCDLEAGLAKLLGAAVAWACADNALQIHGGNGYATEYQISRVLCDARILNIFEGAAEIQAQVIARRLLDG